MLTYFNLFMTLCFLPVSMGTVQVIDGKKLVNEKNARAWGQLYSNIENPNRIYDRGARAYFFIFVIRRIIIIAIAFFLIEVATFQYLILVFL